MSEKKTTQTTQEITDSHKIETDLVKAELLLKIQILSADMEKARQFRNIRDSKLSDINDSHPH